MAEKAIRLGGESTADAIVSAVDAMYIGIMLVVDLLYGIIDPRIRLAKGDD